MDGLESVLNRNTRKYFRLNSLFGGRGLGCKLGALLAACGLILIALGACGDKESGSPLGTNTPVVTGVTVNPDTIMVIRGQTRTFTATVAGTDSPPQTVVWGVEGGGPGTSISTGGVLTVAVNESAASLIVRATSTYDTSKSGTAIVFAFDEGVIPTVTGVTVNPGSATVIREQTKAFTAAVAGTDNPPQNVTWSVEGGGPGTSISTGGVLTVAVNESAASLIVRAASTYDPSKSGTAIITVTASGGETGPGTEFTITSLPEWNNAVNAVRNGEDLNYFFILNNSSPLDITGIADQDLSFGGRMGISVTVKGSGELVLNSNGSILRMGSGQTLILGEADGSGPILTGKTDNNAPLVYAAGSFVMKGGTIKDNTNTTSSGGGVYGGTFTMAGGTISGNTASSSPGGGVYGDTFTMTGGTISGNTASDGGGVYVWNDNTSTMTGGTIAGNTAPSYGGGVNVGSYGTFTKQSGGIIYGPDADDVALRNTAVSDTYGHAVYVRSSPDKRRNTTAGEGVTLDSTKDGAAGGWEDPVVQYTVTFDADGGSPETQTRTVNRESSVGSSNMPSEPRRSGYAFGGWYTSKNGEGEEFYSLTMVSSNRTVYAKWLDQYTVTFDADGGDPAIQTKTAYSGRSVGTANWPSNPSKSGYLFNGWYTSTNGGGTQFTASTAVNGNITVYAKWSILEDLFLGDALTCLSFSAVDGGAYTITLKRDETIAPQTLSYSGKTVSVTIKGDSMERTVSLSTTGSLFTIRGGVTLTLDNNVTLQGRRGDDHLSLVTVSNGALVMNAGSKISGNTSSSSSRGGGGVSIENGGTFTMNGGTISDNVTSSYGGGGVYVGGIFTMNGGTISGNTADYSYTYGGGGVYVNGGTFTMNGGTISNNTTGKNGGGVYVPAGTFTMNNGTISNNTAGKNGGGVYVDSTSDINWRGTFTMSGGTISGNTAESSGGGVYVIGAAGSFVKSSGTIYGSNADTVLKNTASSDAYGHAVYYIDSSAKMRNTTAGTGVTLDSGTSDNWE
jgi:uncharacterized repeat protein (TIGR02543 family)